jgi:glucose-1-phosphate thymidylyltransferase
MKGILLAGGKGSRLYPTTKAVCKQLLPVYDKPMVYYPLATLMQASIREILCVATPRDIPAYRALLQDGSDLGLDITYAAQSYPGGLAQALLIGEAFIENKPFALILGDNLFDGDDFIEQMQKGTEILRGGMIFGYQVKDPRRYGVVEFDEDNQPISIEEKPLCPQSSYAVPGFYFYGPEVVQMAKQLSPSSRGELEITDVHRALLGEKQLKLSLLKRGCVWFDMGTFDALIEASLFVKAKQERQGFKMACIEELSWRQGWITETQFLKWIDRYQGSEYGNYLYTQMNSKVGNLTRR